MDGSLGSHTAALLEPYTDDPKNSGLPQYEQDVLTRLTKERVIAGFQIGFHAIGDKGVADGAGRLRRRHYRPCRNRPGGDGSPTRPLRAKLGQACSGAAPDLRLRIEHAQVTTPLQMAKFKELKVIASMQPNHLLTDMNWAESRLGPKRAAHSYAWAEFLKRGVTLAFGTDYPVEPVTPFRGLYAAVTRKSETGKRNTIPSKR